MPRIESSEDLERLLDQLVESDKRLARIKEIAGPLPLRLSTADFAGLTDIVVSQHVSKHSAAAIMRRLDLSVNPLTPQQLLNTRDEQLIKVGLTRAKRQTLQGLANAVISRKLDLTTIGDLSTDEAMSCLTQFKGVGPWTAEVYLLFCAGHADIFPAGDVALRTAIGDFLGIEPRPSIEETREIADQWIPLRSIAARLFWAYYAVLKNGTKESSKKY